MVDNKQKRYSGKERKAKKKINIDRESKNMQER